MLEIELYSYKDFLDLKYINIILFFLFLSFLFSVCLLNFSFANEISYSPFVGLDVGVGQTKGDFKQTYVQAIWVNVAEYKSNNNATIVPFGLHAGYEIYFNDTMAIVPKIYFNYSKQTHKHTFKGFISSEDELNIETTFPASMKSIQFNYGLDINYAWDFLSINNMHDFGLTAGIGYEFNNINNIEFGDDKNSEKFSSIKQNGLTFNAGLYYKYDKHHKLGLNFKYKNYASISPSIFKNVVKYSVKPTYLGTLSYSYIF